MSRIVMCGLSHSGKTCYLYGMLRKMMIGVDGFTVTPREMTEDGSSERMSYEKIIRACKRLGDTNLPLSERFPAPSDKIQRYTLDLKHNLKSVETFEWMDYPGEILEHDETNNSKKKFVEYLNDSNCLFVCVDGEYLSDMDDSEEDIIQRLQYDAGGLELNNVLQTVADSEHNWLPPICVIVTKYDMLPEERRKKEFLINIISGKEDSAGNKEYDGVFPVLFNKIGGGHDRIVTICPVTLGKDLENNGRLKPNAVELPICYATYFSQVAKLSVLIDKIEEIKKAYGNDVDKYNSKSFLGRLFSERPTPPISAEEAQKLAEIYESMKNDLDRIQSQIEGLPLFYNGERKEWADLL